MNEFFYSDKEFQQSDLYQQFLKTNSGKGNLKIRAYAASEALPVTGLHIVVSTDVGNDRIVFFDGLTDASGMIDTLSLPAPIFSMNNLIVPTTIVYHINVFYKNKFFQDYQVNMYDGICVVQNINFVPGDSYGDQISCCAGKYYCSSRKAR